MKPKFFLLILLLTASSNALSAGWVFNQKVKLLYAGNVGNWYAIELVGVRPNTDQCALDDNLALAPIDSNSKFNEQWSMLLAAYAAGSSVSVFLNGCLNGYPLISDVMIGEYTG